VVVLPPTVLSPIDLSPTELVVADATYFFLGLLWQPARGHVQKARARLEKAFARLIRLSGLSPYSNRNKMSFISVPCLNTEPCPSLGVVGGGGHTGGGPFQ